MESGDGSRNCEFYLFWRFLCGTIVSGFLVLIYPIPYIRRSETLEDQFAGILEGMANRLEGEPAEAPDNFNDSLQKLKQTVEDYLTTEPQTALAAGLRSYLARIRRVSAVTSALLQEI